MNRTVIGAFENNSEALQAKEELLAAGFSEQIMQMHYCSEPVADEDRPNDNPGFMEAIRSLFTWDLDHYRDENYGDHYVEAVRRGHAVLTVTVDDSEVERVCELMDGAGALDIDQRVSQWRSEGYTGSEKAPIDDEGMDQQVADTATTSVASNAASSGLGLTAGGPGTPVVGQGNLDSTVNTGLNTNLNHGLGAGYEDTGTAQATSRNNVRVVPGNSHAGRSVPNP
ncbi:MAG TPA: hypothetical protein VEA39_04820 [Methylophilaceae bacterium]|nr:hypothetical protein [Methylophilaceae bacterium]